MRTTLIIIIAIVLPFCASAQNNVGIGTISPSSNAILHLENGASDLGLLLPNVDHTTFSPFGTDIGMMIYDDNEDKVYIWDGSNWISSTSEWGLNGTDIFSLNSGNVGIGTNTPGEKLTVVNNVFGAIASLNSSGGNTLMDFNNTGTNPANWRFGYLGNTGGNPGYMTFLRGSHRFVITNNGDVGIAETNPQARLEINSSGNSSASHALLVNNATPTNLFSVRDDGNVGIGNSNPDETLTVGDPLGVGYVFPAISVGGAASGGGLVIGSTTNVLTIEHSNTFNRSRIISTDVGGFGQGDIEFRVGGIGINTPTPQNDLDVEGSVAIGSAFSGTSIAPTDGLIVEGQVGIGTSTVSASNMLEVNTTNNPYTAFFDNNYSGPLVQYGIYNRIDQSSSSVFGIYSLNNTSGTNPFYGLRIFYAGTGTGTRYGLTISNEDINYLTGDLGIGTAVPAYDLTLGGTGQVFAVENTGTFVARNSGGTYENYLWPRWSDDIMYLNYGSGGFHIRNNSSAGAMFMTNSNDIGIGTTSPATQFHFNHRTGLTNGLSISNNFDSDRWHFYCFTTNNLRLYFNGSERGTFNWVTGAYSSVSDRRFKKDINPMPNVLDKVSQLQPVEYKFKWQENSQDTYTGFIAQDVKPLFPSLVSQTKSDHPSENSGNINNSYSLDYSGFSVIAIKAIQELQAQNEALLKRIEALENK